MQPLAGESATYYAEYGLANISAYVTVSEKRYSEFLSIFNLTGSLPDLINLKYLVMPQSEYQSQQGKLAGKYSPVFSSASGMLVLENRTVLPKAWLVPTVMVIPDPAQRLGVMSDPRFDAAQVAIVESPPPLTMQPPQSGYLAGAAKVDVYKPNQIVISTSVGQNSLLVLGEKFYSWWYASVDGKRVDIVPVNHILRGVYLTPGEHRIEFVFDPLPFKIGKWLTLSSFVLFAVLAGREWRLRRRRSSEVREGDEPADIA